MRLSFESSVLCRSLCRGQLISYNPVGGGLQSLQLEDQGDSISQIINTIIGQEYLLSFDLSAHSSIGTLQVAVGITGVSSMLYTGDKNSYQTFTQSSEGFPLQYLDKG